MIHVAVLVPLLYIQQNTFAYVCNICSKTYLHGICKFSVIKHHNLYVKTNVSILHVYVTFLLDSICCLGFFVSLENFSLIWRCYHCRRSAANFDLCSALMAIEQWGFLSVPHLLWYGASVYNGHLRRPVTLFTTYRSVANIIMIRTPNLPLARRTL